MTNTTGTQNTPVLENGMAYRFKASMYVQAKNAAK
jgi:hypothetical protein